MRLLRALRSKNKNVGIDHILYDTEINIFHAF